MSTKSLSGLTEAESQEFHSFYQQGLIMFTAIAVVAHFLVWLWRPWLPPAEGYSAASLDGVIETAANLLPMLS